MRLKSAREDFETTTLEAVPGLLGRLSYVGRLQDSKGKYEHWGLAKVYGNEAAQGAISASHRGLLSEVLRRPLKGLLKDVLASCSNEQMEEREFLAKLAVTSPKHPSPAVRAHLASVLSALSALVESRDHANLRGASQPPPPAQELRPPAGT